MSEDIRIWEIKNNESLSELKKAKLNLEERLEKWIEKDISIISSDLLIIGRQVITRFGGEIDLLCLDSRGDVVIIELKRDRTPRDVTAQILDYATWVKDLSNEDITNIANSYLGTQGSLEDVFRNRFGQELPEDINENHKMLIVSSELDDSTERIINYLSDSLGASINAVKFQYFKNNNDIEYLARIFLIEPSEVERKARELSKRKPPLSFEEFRGIAQSNGVGELFDSFIAEVTPIFEKRLTTQTTMSWIGQSENRMITILNILPKESTIEKGLHFYTYIDRLATYFHSEKQELLKYFPQDIDKSKTLYGNLPTIFGYFHNVEEIKNFSNGLKLKKNIK